MELCERIIQMVPTPDEVGESDRKTELERTHQLARALRKILGALDIHKADDLHGFVVELKENGDVIHPVIDLGGTKVALGGKNFSKDYSVGGYMDGRKINWRGKTGEKTYKGPGTEGDYIYLRGSSGKPHVVLEDFLSATGYPLEKVVGSLKRASS